MALRDLTNDALNLECDECVMGRRNPEQSDGPCEGGLTVIEEFDAVPDDPLTIEKFGSSGYPLHRTRQFEALPHHARLNTTKAHD